MSIARNLGDFAPRTSSGPTKPALSLPNLGETTTVSAVAATGTINYDVINQSVLYYTTAATGNWTLNLRGNASTTFASFISVGQSVEIKFLVTNGATAYVPSAFNIDGTAVTVSWAGGTAPSSGTANAVDEYAYTVICTAASTYTVYGQRATSTAAAATGGGGFSNMAVLTSGTSWTAPAGVTKIKVYATGGGGGSQLSSYNASTGFPGTSGAGGGTAIKVFTVVPGTSYTYAIGAAGAAGTTNSAPATYGTPGGDTTFTVGGLTITGGGGSQATYYYGAAGSSGVGNVATGGIATNGDLNLSGGFAYSTSTGGIGGASYWGASVSTPSTNNRFLIPTLTQNYGVGGVGIRVGAAGVTGDQVSYPGGQGIIVIEY